ncbi:Tad domain-containing protein [Bacillus sp. B15-48]|uniref:Tad domain-containing protein n=1 Tax=Bacillus sp. B15-48 TaxID=1548601 RepID=UPI00193ECCA6|nr:Tad domain-containing protein [Bacillus sp. B15-48]MBM4764497.1 hypothetical protein [Bacillus sp. B15-48]
MKWKHLLKSENGQALVFTALLLTGLLGFTGLVIDGGKLYLAKSQLQKAVDAGALAGGDVMLKSKADSGSFNHPTANTEAMKISGNNYNGTGISYAACFRNQAETNCSGMNATANVIQVNGREEVALVLMPILGISSTVTVEARAEVQIGSVGTVYAGNIIPIGIKKEEAQGLEFGTIWDISDSPGEGFQGNYSFLDFSSIHESGPNGANGVKYYIENGAQVPISVNQQIKTENGVMTGPVNTAITAKIGEIVYVPIVSEITSNTVTVLGFAAMKIIDYDTSSKTVKAQFLEEVLEGDIGGGSNEYGTYTSKMIL